MNVIDARVAIITGASLGIGSAVAERLAKDGCSVVINYSSSPIPAEKLARKIDAAGGPALVVRADVSDPAAVQDMFSSTEAAFGGIDILVNNAGVMRLANLAE